MSVDLYKPKGRQTKTDNWHYRFTIEGQRVRKSTGTNIKAIAEEVANTHYVRAVKASLHGPETVWTFTDAAQIYIKDGGNPRFLPPLIRYFGNTKIVEIMPPSIREAAQSLYPKCKAATQNRQGIVPARAVINHCLEKVGRKIFVDNIPQEKAEERDHADINWINTFIQSCETLTTKIECPDDIERLNRLAAYMLFVFTTGARQGQAIDLTWSAVNLQSARAEVSTSKTGPKGAKHSRRQAILISRLVAMLANLSKVNPHGRVFGYYDKKMLNRHIDEIIKVAGLKRLTSHEYGRHGYATHAYVEKKMDDIAAASAGGWSNPDLIRSTYGHSKPDQSKMNEIFDDITPQIKSK